MKNREQEADQHCMGKDGCTNPIHCRGVCAACLSRMNYNVKKKRVTWRALERAGFVLPSKGRGRNNTTVAALKKRQQGSK